MVVVVALDNTPEPLTNGYVAHRARRSLEAAGLSIVAGQSQGGGPSSPQANKAKLLLVKEETEDLAPTRTEGGPQGGVPGGPVIVFTSAVDEKAARAALVTGGLGYIVKAVATTTVAAASVPTPKSDMVRHEVLAKSLDSSLRAPGARPRPH